MCKKYGAYNLAANGTVFDPTMTDIDVYLAEAIPDFDGFDVASNASVDIHPNEREDIKPTIDEPEIVIRAVEKIEKIKVKTENMLQTPAKRFRLNNGYVDNAAANEQEARRSVIKPLQNSKNIEQTSSPIQSKKVLDGISSNIAAEVTKSLALTEEKLKNLVNQRLEAVLSDVRANHKRQIDAMARELADAKSQLQQANDEKSELQQIVNRKTLLLENRERQLKQAHLNCSDLMEELQNAKKLCDTCGKKYSP